VDRIGAQWEVAKREFAPTGRNGIADNPRIHIRGPYLGARNCRSRGIGDGAVNGSAESLRQR
jgi:hypothetical protein